MWNRQLCLALMSPYGDEKLTADKEIKLICEKYFSYFFGKRLVSHEYPYKP